MTGVLPLSPWCGHERPHAVCHPALYAPRWAGSQVLIRSDQTDVCAKNIIVGEGQALFGMTGRKGHLGCIHFFHHQNLIFYQA